MAAMPGIPDTASVRYKAVMCMLVTVCLLIPTVAESALGGMQMNYRVIEEHYGPEIHFNDWETKGGELVSAGGTLQIFAEATATVTRNDYPLAGGGDIELSLSFNLERIGDDGSLTVQFNSRRRGAVGFQVIIDKQHVTALHKDKEVFKGDSPSTDKDASHTVKLATLAESYAIYLNGECLASGQMDPPFAENEGRLRLIVHDADVRVIDCEESFIVHDVGFPGWERTELLYEEKFGEASLASNWVCTGEAPEFREDCGLFNPMSVCALKQRFEGPIAVDCIATPSPTEEFSAGVTDAIFIWMLDKPDGDLVEYMEGLPDGSLSHYMPLPFYWVDFGGTNNKTTRMRKNPDRQMVRQFSDRARLLDRGKSYQVTLVQNGNVIEFWVDEERWIQIYDPTPLSSGHVGFRAYVAGLTIGELKIWRIK